MNRIYLFLLMGLMASNVMADNKQTITINGSTVDKTVKEITFDGDNVTLVYSDETSQMEDMSLVKLAFAYEGSATGINQVESVKKALQGKVFNLNGQLVGTSTDGLSKGIYIVDGKKVIIK